MLYCMLCKFIPGRVQLCSLSCTDTGVAHQVARGQCGCSDAGQHNGRVTA